MLSVGGTQLLAVVEAWQARETGETNRGGDNRPGEGAAPDLVDADDVSCATGAQRLVQAQPPGLAAGTLTKMRALASTAQRCELRWRRRGLRRAALPLRSRKK